MEDAEFSVILNNKYYLKNSYKCRVNSEVKEVFAPKNLIHRILKMFHLPFKNKVVGYKYEIVIED